MIVFERLTFQNFLSVGNNPVTINLNDHKTTLIHGTNGSGKSLMLDALCYVLFNKPFRSINLPQLINSSNKKGLLTEVEFSIGNTKFTVARGMKPKVFQIYKDGELLDAKAADKDNQKYLEQNILKMNLKTFNQVVILGSGNYMPFMQLNSAARRECVEDFLDIKVFSTMSVLAKERLRGLKDRVQEVRGDISNLEYKIDLQRDRVDELRERSASDIDELNTEINDCKRMKEENDQRIIQLQTEDAVILEEVRKLMVNSPKKKASEFNDVIVKLDSKLERLKKDLDFYNKHDECPTCAQTINSELKESVLSKTVEESKTIISARDQASKKHNDLKAVLDQILEKEEQAYKLQAEVSQNQIRNDALQKQIVTKENKIVAISTGTSNIDKEIGKLSALEEQLEDLKKKNDSVVSEIHDHDIVVNLLKDSGIKTQIVRKYLPVINRSIRSRLTDLEFPVLFTLDEEFNETVASPLHQDFSYGSFSEGQKARIDLSMMFTWREVGKIKNSVSTNILILDEVFSSSLDDVGKQNLLALLRYGLDDSQRVLVVDHTLSQEFRDKFDHSIEVSKVKGFSKYS
jgi:DNA repair exonuclease SbcCD ATPase subunit